MSQMNQTHEFSQQNLSAALGRKPLSAVSAGISSKILPPKQLKDIIQDIYTQKLKFDQKARDLGQAIETMEQFMYTYLVQKYGLKSLIVEWATAIINSIKFYIQPQNENAAEDTTVSLFAKILKN